MTFKRDWWAYEDKTEYEFIKQKRQHPKTGNKKKLARILRELAEKRKSTSPHGGANED